MASSFMRMNVASGSVLEYELREPMVSSCSLYRFILGTASVSICFRALRSSLLRLSASTFSLMRSTLFGYVFGRKFLRHGIFLILNSVVLFYLSEQSLGFCLESGIVFLNRTTPHKRVLVGYRFYLGSVDILYFQRHKAFFMEQPDTTWVNTASKPSFNRLPR